MTTTEVAGIFPLVVLSSTLVGLLLAMMFGRSHMVSAALTFAGLALTFCSLFGFRGELSRGVTALIIVDAYSRFFTGLILLASMGTAVLSFRYLKGFKDRIEEFYVLLLAATLGATVMVASNHLVSFFLGLELLSISLYAMIAYKRQNDESLEAGIKYLILAATSSAFLLFGMALIYAELGTMQFAEIAVALSSNARSADPFVLGGFALLVVGIGFKLGVVPFHMWTPDVYEGAPAPVTAFVATVSKGAMFALLMRFFLGVNLAQYTTLVEVFSLISATSMFVGNFLALRQTNVKRILAYSSIAHLGYLLVAFIAGGKLASEAILYYLAAYFLTTMAAFGIVTILSNSDRECEELEDYRGLFWSRPWVAAVFTAALLSLAGIPLTAGFIGKYFVITAGVGAAQWVLVIILVANSAIGLYYYLRVVVAMFSQPVRQAADDLRLNAGEGIVLATLMAGLLLFGMYPPPLLDLVRFAISSILV